MITYAPRTFTVSRLTSLCRQSLAHSLSSESHGLSSTATTKELHNQPCITLKSFSHAPYFSEGVLRNKIERARMAQLRRQGKI